MNEHSQGLILCFLVILSIFLFSVEKQLGDLEIIPNIGSDYEKMKTQKDVDNGLLEWYISEDANIRYLVVELCRMMFEEFGKDSVSISWSRMMDGVEVRHINWRTVDSGWDSSNIQIIWVK